MKFAPFITIALIAAATATGCKKDSDTNPNNNNNNNNKTKTELLTAGKWQETSYVETWTDEKGQAHTDDIHSNHKACTLDDFITFNSNGKIIQDEGPTKCNPNSAQTYEGVSWQLINNDSQIKSTEDGVTTTFDIVELSNTSLKLKRVYDDGEGLMVTANSSYSNIK